MLGGSCSMQHLLHTIGDPHDYNQWATILNDTAWNITNIIPYLKKIECLTDEEVLQSEHGSLHGTDGMMKIMRPTSSTNKEYLAAFEELGHKVVLDTTSLDSSIGYVDAMFAIGDNIRQSGALAYVSPAKSRSNLHIALFTTATKILIENGAAVGVQVTTSSGETFLLYANNEVIVSAGAINSPKLLMLSGIGPKTDLEILGIEVVADLPVGENFQDHPSAVVIYQMDESKDATKSIDPHTFPVPTFLGYVAFNSSQSYPDYDSINLVFPHDSPDLLQLCSNMFKYTNDICQKFYDANKGRNMLFSLVGVVMPKSRGKVVLASTNPAVAPLVYARTFSDRSDLKLLGKALGDYNKVLNTTYFRSVNATLVNTGVCSDASSETEFWECYAVAMSTTMWHYAGTCAMGSVLDSDLHVKGVKRLRVVDASSMPTLISGKINAAVVIIAEHAADLILDEWSIFS